jgi:hypothetical protein
MSARAGHSAPHIDDGLCLCDCGQCVGPWMPMTFGGARRRCICSECSGGDCPPWRLDQELHDLVATHGEQP